jgi:hypothetical protein
MVATEQAESLRVENVTLKEQLVEAREQCGAAENRVHDSQIKVQALQGRSDEMEKRLAGQEQAQIGHLQATLKEERRVYRIEIANVLQGKVAQLRSLGEKPAAPELVEAYRAVISGLLSSLESQGVQLER